MGFLDDITGKIKNEVGWKIGQEASDGIGKITSKIFNKEASGDGALKCPKCKKKITDPSLRFCPDCGQKLLLTCPKCNIDYPFGTKFCTQCGEPLK
jgi:predicted amidophosphoribosyltransferase